MNFKNCEIVTQLVNKETDEPYIDDIETIINTIENDPVIKQAIIFFHDQGDDKNNPEPHLHIPMNFGKSSLSDKTIANKFHTLPQNVGKITSTWAECVVYGLHMNAPEKIQYTKENILYAKNVDFDAQVEDWKKIKEKRLSKKQLEVQIDLWLDQIYTGEIREYNKHEFIDFKILAKKKTLFDNAFKERANILANNKERNMKVFYLIGASETYKTTYAKKYCDDHNLSCYISSGSNDVLDGYKGQDALILDDLRPSCMGLVDLLKMLDNHTSSSVKSRFKNKVLECQVVFITTTKPIEEFFSGVFENEDEPLKQLVRRCGTYLEFQNDNMIEVSFYDSLKGEYVKQGLVENPCANMHPKTSLTEDEIQARMDDMGFEFIVRYEDEFIPIKESNDCPFESETTVEQMELDGLPI